MSSRSSASIRVVPPSPDARSSLHASNLERGPGLRKAEPTSSASDTEQDDERPTQRRIPIGQRDPKPENTGTIVHAYGEVHAFAPGAQWLGRYPNSVVAQRRLDLFFGRGPGGRHTPPLGDDRKSARADLPGVSPSAAVQGRKPEGGAR